MVRFIVCIAVLCSLSLAGAVAPAPSPDLRIRIAVPSRDIITARDNQSHFHVVIENISDRPQKIIDEWNSWGYFNLQFEYTTSDGQKKVMRKLGRDWSKNFLTTTTLKPSEVMVWDVYLDSSVWSDLPIPGRGEAPVTIRATFAQQDDKIDAWHGAVSSPDQQITFRNQHEP